MKKILLKIFGHIVTRIGVGGLLFKTRTLFRLLKSQSICVPGVQIVSEVTTNLRLVQVPLVSIQCHVRTPTHHKLPF